MDGNGRWATAQSKPRTFGHKQGLETAKKIVKLASDLGINYITLYVFSSENWKRTEKEVGFLMSLIETHLVAEFEFYKANNIRVKHIGDLEKLPAGVQAAIKKATCETAHFSGTTVVLAINYGGQDEIFRACKKSFQKLLTENLDKIPKPNLEKETFINKILSIFENKNFEQNLDTSEFPQVDLLIRTGGEKRISNFLLYQIAYAELYFSDKFWPDWTEEDFKKAILDFENRERRFGKA